MDKKSKVKITSYSAGPWSLSSDGEIVSLAGKQVSGICHMPFSSLGEAKEIEGSEANARLIAAAPELLEALKMACAWIDNAGKPQKYMPLGIGSFQDLTLAISKAEGN